ncbi:DUF2341 domain-containing protein [Bacteroidota bacterium]
MNNKELNEAIRKCREYKKEIKDNLNGIKKKYKKKSERKEIISNYLQGKTEKEWMKIYDGHINSYRKERIKSQVSKIAKSNLMVPILIFIVISVLFAVSSVIFDDVSFTGLFLQERKLIEIKNSDGEGYSSRITLTGETGERVDLPDKPDDVNYSDSTLQEESYEVEVILKDDSVEKILFHDMKIKGQLELGFEEIKELNDSTAKALKPQKIFAVNPEKLNFTTATLTAEAKGEVLYKCADWNFSEQKCYGRWQKIKDIVPGETYTLTLTADDPGYMETGLATVNTDKSIYHPGETVEIIMVVLDSQGFLVSSANASLNVTSPNGLSVIFSIDFGTIIETEKGIYRAQYENTETLGVYELFISATAENVESNMSSFFLVDDFYKFDIIRSSPVSIDPWSGPFESSIKITSFNHTGTFNFTEVLPSSFAVYEHSEAVITHDSTSKYLTWSNLESGAEVTYSANSPFVSPELYELGPSFVSYEQGIFYEARPWYLAVDPAWYNISWSKRKEITIDSEKVSASLTDFPVLIELFDTDLHDDTLSNGNDILFTASDGTTKLSHEIEFYNQSYNSTYAHLVAWVKANLSASTNTTIYMYYNNSGASDQQDAVNVWDENHSIVWHLWDSSGPSQDSTSNNRDGTWGSQKTSADAIDGIIGTGSDFDGVAGDEITRAFSFPTDHTISFWYNRDNIVGSWDILFEGTGLSNDDPYLGFGSPADSTTSAIEVWFDGSFRWSSDDKNLDEWYYFTFVTDGAGSRLYINGADESGVMPAYSDINTGFGLGDVNDGPFDGILDEFRFSSAVRSADWINASYQNQNSPSTFYEVGSEESLDLIPPNVTSLTNPPPDSVIDAVSGNVIDFNFTVTDNTAIANCSLYTNFSGSWTRNKTVYNVANNTETNITVTVEDGTFIWNVLCYDSQENPDWYDTNYTITIDTTYPSISFSNGTELNNSFVGRSWVFVNVSANDSNEANITFYLFNSSFDNINVSTLGAGNRNINFSNLANGVYYYNVSILDMVNHENFTETRKITLDTTEPSIELNAPENSFNDTNSSVVFNWTASDSLASVFECNLSIDGVTNVTVNVSSGTAWNETVSELIASLYYWNVTCTDLAGNINTSETRMFNISLPPADLYIDSSRLSFSNLNPELLDNITIFANVTNLGGANASNVFVEFWDGLPGSGIYIGNDTRNVNVDTNITFNVSWNITAGYHNVWVVVDPYNTTQEQTEINNNATINISVLRSFINSAFNNSWSANATVEINFTLQDFTGGAINYTIFVDGTPNGQNGSVTDNVSSLLNVSLVSDGTHIILVEALDSLGRSRNSSNITTFVDTALPSIALHFPEPDNITNVSTVYFNWTSSDNLASVLECNFSIDSVSEALVNVTNGIAWNETVSGITAGLHYWNVSCIDLAGNINTSETRMINISLSFSDLFIDNSRITFSNDVPDLFENITVFANVSNLGTVNTNYVLVDFWDGLPGIGIYIGNDTRNVSAGESVLFNVTWNISGYHSVWVIVDPYNVTDEDNETNNNATINTSVLSSTINFPLNNTWSTNAIIELNFTLQDYSSGSVNYSVYVDEFLNVQNGSVTDNVSSLLNVSLVSDGTHTIIVEVLDSLSRKKNSSALYIRYDSTPPNPNFETLNGTFFSDSTPEISFNITDNLANIINYTVFVDGSYDQNSSVSNGISTNINLSVLVEGLHTVTIEGEDEVGIRQNNSIIIFVDLTGSAMNLLYPSDEENFTLFTVELNFSVSDNLDELLTCNLTLDSVVIREGFNVSNGSVSNTTSPALSEGIHYWNVSCWDGRDNNNIVNLNVSETRSFNILLEPNITLTSPANGTWSNNASQTFYFNASDDTGLENCSLLIDGVVNVTKSGSQLVNGGQNNFTANSLNGSHVWGVECYDNTSFNIYSVSANRFLFVDLQSPQPFIETVNGSWFNTASPGIDFNISDDMDAVLNYSFFVNGSLNVQGVVGNASSDSANLQNLDNGSFFVVLEGLDEAGNRLNSSGITIFVDSVVPSIELHYPELGNITSGSTVYFNWTASDNLASVLECNFSIDGISKALVNVTNGIAWNETVQELNFSLHYWNVTCIDFAGNKNTSETRNFSLPEDNDPPNVTLLSPANPYNSLTGGIDFNYSVSDANRIFNCSLFINNQRNQTAYNVSRDVTNTFTSILTSDGIYDWTVNCTDAAFNEGNTSERQINVTIIIRNYVMISDALGDTSLWLETVVVNPSSENLIVSQIEFNVANTSMSWVSLDAGDDPNNNLTTYWSIAGEDLVWNGSSFTIEPNSIARWKVRATGNMSTGPAVTNVETKITSSAGTFSNIKSVNVGNDSVLGILYNNVDDTISGADYPTGDNIMLYNSSDDLVQPGVNHEFKLYVSERKDMAIAANGILTIIIPDSFSNVQVSTTQTDWSNINLSGGSDSDWKINATLDLTLRNSDVGFQFNATPPLSTDNEIYIIETNFSFVSSKFFSANAVTESVLEVSEDDYPIISNENHNITTTAGYYMVKGGDTVKLNVSVTDDFGVSAVLFTINGTNESPGQNGDEYFFNQICTQSQEHNWTAVFVNDTQNQWSSNTTINLTWYCDADGPYTPSANISDFNAGDWLYGTNVTVNCNHNGDVGQAGVNTSSHQYQENSSGSFIDITGCAATGTQCNWTLPSDVRPVGVQCRVFDELEQSSSWNLISYAGIDNTPPTIANENVSNSTLILGDDPQCMNVSVNDLFNNISSVVATVHQPGGGGDVEVTLLDDGLSCDNTAGDNIYSVQFNPEFGGLHNWTTTIANDSLNNVNSTNPGLTFYVVVGPSMTTSMISPAANIIINESGGGNYYVQDCSTLCNSSGQVCGNVSLFTQYNPSLWTQITDITTQLTSNVSLYSCGNMAANETCNRSFLVNSNEGSGNNIWPIRCKATSDNSSAGISSSVNLTINDRPNINFTNPASGTWINSYYTLNCSASDSDGSISTTDYFESTDNSSFSYIGSCVNLTGDKTNCTYDTGSSVCSEYSNCYLRCTAFDEKSANRSAYTYVHIDNTGPNSIMIQPLANGYVNVDNYFLWVQLNDTPGIGGDTAFFQYRENETHSYGTRASGNIGGAQALFQSNADVPFHTDTDVLIDRIIIRSVNIGSGIFNVTIVDRDNGSKYFLGNGTAGGDVLVNTNNFTLPVGNYTLDYESENDIRCSANDYIFTSISSDIGWKWESSSNRYCGIILYGFAYVNWTDVCNNTGSGNPYNVSCIWNTTNLNEATTYQVRARGNDSLGNIGPYDAEVNITVNHVPIIILESPADNSTILNETVLNFTITDVNLSETWWTMNGGSNNYNWLNGLDDIDTGSWTAGEYNITVFANDSIGGFSDTINESYRFVIFEDYWPVIGSDYAINVSSVQINGSSVKLNVTVTDDFGVDIVRFYYKGSYKETSENGDEYYLIDACNESGNHFWTSIWVNDSRNRISTEAISLSWTCDLDAPSIVLNEPAPGEILSTANITFNFTYIDALSPNATCNLTVNGIVRETLEVYNNTPMSTTQTGFGIGTYNWNVTCIDRGGIVNTSTTRNFTVDDAPAITLDVPENNTYTNDDLTIFFFNVSEETDISNCSLILNNTINSTKSSPLIQNNAKNNITVNLSTGNYEWSINCTDTEENTGASKTKKIITVDKVLPVIFSLLSPNGTTSNNLTPIFYWEQTFESNMGNYTLQIDDDSGFTSIDYVYTVYGLDNTSVHVSIGTDTTWYWRVIAYDLASNSRTSNEIFNYTTDTSPPVVILQAPSNNDTDPDGDVSFFYTVTDRNLTSCTLYTNISGTFESNETDLFVTNGLNLFQLYDLQQDTLFVWNVNCTDNFGYSAFYTENWTVKIRSPETFYQNITIPTNLSVNNTLPRILNISVPNPVNLLAGTNTSVNCTVIVEDDNGANDSQVNATFYHETSYSSAPDDYNNHYSTSSCTCINTDALTNNCTCEFKMRYYALNGTWTCNATATDDEGSVIDSTTTYLNELKAIFVDPLIDYGNLEAGSISTDVNVTIINYGNIPIDVSLFGYGATPNDYLAMICPERSISIAYEKFDLSYGTSFGSMIPLSGNSSSPNLIDVNISKKTNESVDGTVDIYWKLQVFPLSSPVGICNGSVAFTAEVNT